MSLASHAPKRAILFDLDGTLIDSGPDIRTALNLVLEAQDLAPLSLEETLARVGKGALPLVTKAFAYRNRPLSDEEAKTQTALFAKHYAAHSLVETKPYPGIPRLLEQLKDKNIPMAVVTNKLEDITHALLQALNFHPYFPVVVGGDTVGHRKPDPAPLYYALDKLNMSRQDALFVGDSASDSGAAAAAGMDMIAVSWGYCHGDPRALPATTFVETVKDLSDHLMAFTNESKT